MPFTSPQVDHGYHTCRVLHHKWTMAIIHAVQCLPYTLNMNTLRRQVAGRCKAPRVAGKTFVGLTQTAGQPTKFYQYATTSKVPT